MQRAECVPIRSQQFSFAPLSLAPRVEVLAMKVDAAAAGGSVVGNRCADQGYSCWSYPEMSTHGSMMEICFLEVAPRGPVDDELSIDRACVRRKR